MLSENEQKIYFIGIALPEPLNDQVSRLMWKLYDENNPQMLKPLLPHVTLLHPPTLRGTLPEELIPKVQEATRPYLPLNIELGKIRYFNEHVCSLQAESLSLHSLYQKLIPALPFEVQAEQLKRDFAPHVTLVQVKHPYKLDKKRIENEIEKSLTFPIRFEVNSLTCFRRILPRTYKPSRM